jgi:uncharacterized protein YbaP (TraB family)
LCRDDRLRIVLAATLAATLTIPQTAVAQAPEAAPAERSFLWKVTGPGGSIYLAGSVHLLTRDYYPLSPAMDAAFDDSDLLVEEADLGELDAPASQFELLTRGLLPAGLSLEKVVEPSTYALITSRVADLGMPIEPLMRFKPWMLALTLVQIEWQKAGFEASFGLDRHFYDRATKEGKAVEALETLDYQISLFDDLTWELQDRLLAESLENADAERANVRQLVDAWKAGNAAAVEQLLFDELQDDPVLSRRLLADRNRNWLPKLDQLLTRRGRAFVVVGAAHLVGPDGLLALFKARGYRLEQL